MNSYNFLLAVNELPKCKTCNQFRNESNENVSESSINIVLCKFNYDYHRIQNVNIWIMNLF